MVYIFENINTVTNDLLKKFDSLYTEERKIKSGKYCREDDKKKSLIAYILLLYALKKEYGIFEKLYFDYGKNNKPFLKNIKIYISVYLIQVNMYPLRQISIISELTLKDT